MVLRELVPFGPSIRPHGDLLFSLIQKKPAFVRDSGGLQLFPKLKCGGEACDNVQADNVSNEALYVIGLHGSGDKISLFLQDWEVAKVPLSCQKALDTLCQEKTKLKGDVVGLVFERVCRLSDKPL